MVRYGWGKLEQLSCSKLAHELFVGVQEIQSWKVTAFYPSNFAKNPVLQFILVAIDNVEVQVDRVAILVGVQNSRNLAPDFCADPQFFVKFAAQCLGRSFAGLDFSTGKLPLESEGLVLRPLTAQDFVSAHDQCSHHLLGQDGIPILAGGLGWETITRLSPDIVQPGLRSARPVVDRRR